MSVVNSTTTRQYYSAVGMTLEKRGNQTLARYVRAPDGRRILVSNADGIYYYLYDGSMNVVGLIKINGTVGYYDYRPFGEDVGTPFNTYNPCQYSSTYRDQGSAGKTLYHMMARYHDPAYGRFTRADYWEARWLPKVYGGMFSLSDYGYVVNNPLTLTDPYGHFCGWSCLTKNAAHKAESALHATAIVAVGFGVGAVLIGAGVTVAGVGGPAGWFAGGVSVVAGVAAIGASGYAGYQVASQPWRNHH